SAKNNTLVLFECKAGNNPEEMPTPEKLLGKAFLEAVAYYCFEKDVLHNDHMKHVVVTNVREWYVFDAADFRAATHGKAKIRDAFKSWNKGNWDNSSTAALHKRIAELLSDGDDVLHGVHVDLWSFKKYLDRDDEQARTELLKLYRFLSPGFLLKEGTGKDNNTLNKGFYNELLHILGLHETKEKGVKRIKRLPEDKRHQGMLIENTIVRLKNDGCLARLEHKVQYGDTEDEQLFAVAMELCITWLDRILFLKLLEAQLLRYHDGDRLHAFLAPTDEGQQYDYLITLYPNPTSGLFTISTGGSGPMRIAVYNSTGQQVRQLQRGAADRCELDLGNEASGLYTVRVMQGAVTTRLQVMVEH
ncbi:MAG: T9SS type A sorting domain-containing protein, partial [Flavobacteriales bacterium]